LLAHSLSHHFNPFHSSLTDKFESRYCDQLIGPYPAAADVYEERSPVNHTDQLSCPVLLLQGADDKVVPPDQAETMFRVMKGKGIPCAYVLFEGEGHGFRQAQNIERALNAELYFYSRVFGFSADCAGETVDILNLEEGC
jgi:dipeptidyl aminopeptidase/acylaminoacyl peptidase